MVSVYDRLISVCTFILWNHPSVCLIQIVAVGQYLVASFFLDKRYEMGAVYV